MRHSHAQEEFSHFVVAVIGTALLFGVVAWTYAAFEHLGCSVGVPCRTPAEMSQVHY